MAFDLVQYFAEQIETQKPELLSQLSREERRHHISAINALALGELITQWRANDKKVYQEITAPDELYILEVARHLTTSKENASTIPHAELEALTAAIFSLQLHELKQLHDTGSHNLQSIRELLLGQIEHLSGQADDWVWSTNGLLELQGSKTIHQEDISLDSTMKEFNLMVQQHTHTDDNQVSIETVTPTWAKIIEPVVALVILWIVAQALCSVFA